MFPRSCAPRCTTKRRSATPPIQEFSDAREEGFGRNIADAFAAIATIEGTHAQRFTRFADALESGELFSIRGETAWLCLNCGHVHFGPEAPKACPVCSHDQGL